MQETSGLSAIASQPVRTADTPGTVRVYAVIRATVEEAWAALTQRELVGRWFGDLSESLQPGGAHRLDKFSTWRSILLSACSIAGGFWEPGRAT